jgi:hypothetical protein
LYIIAYFSVYRLPFALQPHSIPMAETISSRRRSGQENVEFKAPYEIDEKLEVPHVISSADSYHDVWGDTDNDIRDMQRLGKKQEFKVMTSSQEGVAIG